MAWLGTWLVVNVPTFTAGISPSSITATPPAINALTLSCFVSFALRSATTAASSSATELSCNTGKPVISKSGITSN